MRLEDGASYADSSRPLFLLDRVRFRSKKAVAPLHRRYVKIREARYFRLVERLG